MVAIYEGEIDDDLKAKFTRVLSKALNAAESEGVSLSEVKLSAGGEITPSKPGDVWICKEQTNKKMKCEKLD